MGQIIGQLLSERLIPFVALDLSSDRVQARFRPCRAGVAERVVVWVGAEVGVLVDVRDNDGPAQGASAVLPLPCADGRPSEAWCHKHGEHVSLLDLQLCGSDVTHAEP